MRLLRSFLSFISPLIIMLLTFAVYLLVNDVVNNYKKTITNDYSIVVISNTPLIKMDKIAGIDIKDIKILSREKIIGKVKDNLSDSSLKLLKTKLPYFYKIYLEEFPTTLKLDQIRKELTTISSVKKVETFSNDHNKVYSLLVLIQDIVIILFSVVLILSFLLISKQIKIWFFEHMERLDIIQLHGGSILYGSKPILKIMIISSIVSSAIIVSLVFFSIENINLIVQPEIISLIPKSIEIYTILFKILLLSFSIPLIIFMGLIIKYKTK